MADDTLTTAQLYGVALGIAVASGLLGLPVMALAHSMGTDASTGLLVAASLPALLPALAAGWMLPSRWGAGVAGAIGVSCASFFTTAPALDVSFVGPMFVAATEQVGPDAMAPVLAETVQEVVLGGWGFAWFVMVAGALLGAGVAWARGVPPGRLTTSEVPTFALLCLAVTSAVTAASLDTMAGAMVSHVGGAYRVGLGLQQLATGTLAGAIGGYLARPPRGQERLVAVLVGGVGLLSVGVSGLVAPGFLPWLAAGWLMGGGLGWWASEDRRRAPEDVVRNSLGEALGVGLCMPFIFSVSGIGVGLAAALGPIQLIGPASGEGVVDTLAVAHDVLYGRSMVWPALFAGVGNLLVVLPLRMLARKAG